jgi:hypothetical protein
LLCSEHHDRISYPHLVARFLRDTRSGETSDAVDRAVLVAEDGIEIGAAALSELLGLRLRLGITGWLPTSDAVVSIDGTSETIQRADTSIVAGCVLAYH